MPTDASPYPDEQSPSTTDREVNKSDFWNGIYIEQQSPRWNLGHPAPSLKHWLETAKPKPGRVLIPGCGYGHDVRLFAEHGFEAIGVDFAPLAVSRALELSKDAPGRFEFRQEDIFDLPKTERSGFDYLYEYTCFVAIKPERRNEFVQLELDLLKPGGMLVGCFYNHGREGGPPFNVTREEVLKLYEPHFKIRELKIAEHSIERRAGRELWAQFVRP